MRWLALILFAFIFIGCTVPVSTETTSQVSQNTSKGETMNLTSKGIQNGGTIPDKYTCQGENVNPELEWTDVPEGTKSFALIVDDPDAPRGTWTHWILKDIPSIIHNIPEDSTLGIEVINSKGSTEYSGPCPPSGTHRYYFKLYALDKETLDAKTIKDINKEIGAHKIAEATLMATYSKK
jgi:Raf kinase inhibitor-like YbhB/YbcL family protein